jgi:hypothetical protein
MNTSKVLSEAVVVGIAFVLFFFAAHGIHMSVDAKQAMKHQGIFTQAFVAGFMGHIAFELSGVNKWYVRQYK